MTFFTIVVLPALSRPLTEVVSTTVGETTAGHTHSISILISLSFSLAFLNIDNIVLEGNILQVKVADACAFRMLHKLGKPHIN